MSEHHLDIKKAAIEIVNSHHILTIASFDTNTPWSSPVYYQFYDGEFYFFSKKQSRHIEDSLKTGNAAASLHADSTGWSEIRGVQMSGHIQKAGINTSSGRAFNAYIKTFNFISEIKNAATSVKDIASVENAFKVTFYKFVPESVYYIDNSIRFGFREEVSL